jgi:site-specific DNA-methyltransferase (adenine-specific)
MKEIKSGSVDMILTDPPYGTTACKWDSIIPLEPMWEQLNRVIKPNGAIVITSAQPFTSVLVMSNLKGFNCEWIYEKTNAKGFLNAKRKPLTSHESVLVFGKAKTYNPQKWTIPEYLRTKRKHATSKTSGEVYGNTKLKRKEDDGSRYPTSVIGFSNRVGRSENYHPTQKPVALMEYLIKTYTNEGDTVLDFTMGSGTTGVAAKNLQRNFIGIELDDKYFEIAKERIESA